LPLRVNNKELFVGFRDWLNRLFAKPESQDTVPFYDFDVGSIVRIPRRELRPGTIEVQIQGMDGLVWVMPDQLQHGPIKHEPFDEEIREYLRQIQTSFAEHRDLTIDEWEDGFRRDANPKREIALWSHAADIYVQFTADDPSADRRRDVYRCIVACMTSSPDSVWSVLKPQALDRSEAERVVNRFYGKDA
jgi:hypothetical protein